MHSVGNEYANASTRCLPTRLRAVRCAATRNEYSGKAALTGERWPTLEAVKKARRCALQSFFREHNVHRQATIDRRIDTSKGEKPLTTDESVIRPARLLVELFLPQLKALSAAIDRLEQEIAHCCSRLADYKLFAALPCAGPALAPRLLVAFGEHRDRFPNAVTFQEYAGIAPVTERSGNKCWVHWRYSCSTFLRQTFIEWVGQTIPRSFWAKAFYEAYRARGGSHQAVSVACEIRVKMAIAAGLSQVLTPEFSLADAGFLVFGPGFG